MDGLTVRSAEGLIETGQTLKELRQGPASPSLPSTQGTSIKSFADTLKDAVGKVNQLQKEADTQMQQLATGKAKSLTDVVIATEKADIAFKLMVQVRNKIIDAYQEIMKMQV